MPSGLVIASTRRSWAPGVSSDGRDTSLMSPRSDGQMLALERAYAEAGVDPAHVELVEGHGTATTVGDHAELDTLRRIFGKADDRARAGVLGSIKSAIGHAMPAAGAAGLIKAVLAVHHGVLPPTLGADEPHPLVAETRFRLLASSEPWDAPLAERLAGVNAFGFGGINAHVVVSGRGAVAPATAPPECWPGAPRFRHRHGRRRGGTRRDLPRGRRRVGPRGAAAATRSAYRPRPRAALKAVRRVSRSCSRPRRAWSWLLASSRRASRGAVGRICGSNPAACSQTAAASRSSSPAWSPPSKLR